MHVCFVFELEANDRKIKDEDVHVLLLVDYNLPYVLVEKSLELHAKLLHKLLAASSLSAACKKTRACIIMLPAIAAASSALGLMDDIGAIEKSLMKQKLNCDGRLSMGFDVPEQSAAYSRIRKFVDGRCVVDHDSRNDNVWANCSELLVEGRSMDPHYPKIPATRETLRPESLDKDKVTSSDAMGARGQRAAYQDKGVPFMKTQLKSAMVGLNDFPNGSGNLWSLIWTNM